MTTIDMAQPRKATGQFDRKINTPPEGSLAESATGSFLYPPRFATAAEHVAFFEEAPISDRVLSNATASYRRWRKDKVQEYIQQKDEEAGNDPKGIQQRMAKQFGSKGLEDARARQMPEWKAEAEALYPIRDLPESHLRAILRAYQMCALRGDLPTAEEQQKVLDHPIRIYDNDHTASNIAAHYATYEWAPRALTENDYAQTEALNRMAGLLARQQGIDDYDD